VSLVGNLKRGHKREGGKFDGGNETPRAQNQKLNIQIVQMTVWGGDEGVMTGCPRIKSTGELLYEEESWPVESSESGDWVKGQRKGKQKKEQFSTRTGRKTDSGHRPALSKVDQLRKKKNTSKERVKRQNLQRGGRKKWAKKT